MKNALSFICGVVFAVGLGISGMTQPARVTAFLDITGNWDPSLAIVMISAVLVYGIGYRMVVKKPKPILALDFQIPKLRKVDRPLALGSALFGVGWGLAGFCPGPAITSIVSLEPAPLIFAGSLLLGMFLYEWTERRRIKS